MFSTTEEKISMIILDYFANGDIHQLTYVIIRLSVPNRISECSHQSIRLERPKLMFVKNENKKIAQRERALKANQILFFIINVS